MLADAWLKVIGAFTPEDIKLLKAQGCASESFVFLEAFDKLTLAWRRTLPGAISKSTWPDTAGAISKSTWNDVQIRLQELQAALREG
jgi:hypothetical protein